MQTAPVSCLAAQETDSWTLVLLYYVDAMLMGWCLLQPSEKGTLHYVLDVQSMKGQLQTNVLLVYIIS